jgi:hypothetical protein
MGSALTDLVNAWSEAQVLDDLASVLASASNAIYR